MPVLLHAWQPFFTTQATVGAALTGLVFVALSINLTPILESPGLSGRAGEALMLLIVPVFIGLAGSLPQTSVRALGVEVIVLALIAWVMVSAIIYAGREAAKARPAHEKVIRIVSAELAVLPLVVGAVVLIAGHPGGLWWLAAGTALCLVTGVVDAWVLLVEILR